MLGLGVWAFGLGGGEEEKMSERVLLVGVVGEGGREGGVEGGVDDILGLEELGGLFSWMFGCGLSCVGEEDPCLVHPSGRSETWVVAGDGPRLGWASPCQVVLGGSLGLRQGVHNRCSQNASSSYNKATKPSESSSEMPLLTNSYLLHPLLEAPKIDHHDALARPT